MDIHKATEDSFILINNNERLKLEAQLYQQNLDYKNKYLEYINELQELLPIFPESEKLIQETWLIIKKLETELETELED